MWPRLTNERGTMESTLLRWTAAGRRKRAFFFCGRRASSRFRMCRLQEYVTHVNGIKEEEVEEEDDEEAGE